MESIKDKVAIIGMGCSKFGERWDAGFWDLVIEAATEALEDAGVDIKDIQAAWLGTTWWSTGQGLAYALKTDYIPVSRVENACGTGLETIRVASYALMAIAYDLVLALGVEKLKDRGAGGLGSGETGKGIQPSYGVQVTPPGRYALAATRHFATFGTEKKHLAMISVKSHHNGARNPRAHLRREITVEQVLNAPIVAWPLGLFDCCGVTDGAAAAILCRTEDVKKFTSNHQNDYMTVKALANSVGPGMGKTREDYDFLHWEETYRAAQQIYQQAGIKDPRKELDLAEVHDRFYIAELIAIESLGFCENGRATEDIEADSFTLEGGLPVNPSGGLKSFGHPIGASGCREVSELYNQMLGRADLPERQFNNPRLGLVHNQGGHPGRFMADV